MNNTRRAAIRKASKLTREAYSLIEYAHDEEDECLNNIPENLSSTSNYEKMEEYVDLLEEAMIQLDIACDAVDQILSI